MKLPMPVICECGFATMDAKKAVKHAQQHEREDKKTTYECVTCGTTFNYAEGEHKNGYLVCPNPKCGSEDLRTITDTEQEGKDE